MAEIIEYTNVFNMDGTPFVKEPDRQRLGYAKFEIFKDGMLEVDYEFTMPITDMLHGLDVLRHDILNASSRT
jgi:hypothetical protein